MRKTPLKKKAPLLLVCLLIATMLLSGCSGKSGTLKIGVRSDIINFGYLNETTGKHYGMEIDIAEEMASRMGYNVEFVDVEPENRKEMLLEGDVDCLVALYSIAETRLKNFDFSDPYYKDEIVLMVEKSTLFDHIKDMKDMNIGVLDGANAAPLLAIKMNELGIVGEDVVSDNEKRTVFDHMEYTKVLAYEKLDGLLEEGKIDAACMDKSIASTYMNDDRMLIETGIEPQSYGVATQKNSALSKEVKATIAEMLKDGTIDKIIDKWN